MAKEEFQAANQQRRTERWERAITISVLAIVASGILTIAANDAFFPPPSRRRSPGIACIANLKTIDGAKATWALENHKADADIPKDVELFGKTNYISEKPVCPLGGRYSLRPVAKKPRCTVAGHTL